MLKSMTGFGAGSAENESFRADAEIKSVNQRYLDIDIRAPRCLDRFAEAMKGKVREYASRGKFTISVQFLDKRERAVSIRVDKNLAAAYHGALNEISDALRLPRPDDVMAIAAYPGVLLAVEESSAMDEAEPVILEAIDLAMAELSAMRASEGENLAKDLIKRVETLEKYTDEIASLGPRITERYRERLEKTIKELLSASEIDESRIVQETAIFADKSDYTEEMVRLRSHFDQLRRLVSEADEPVGRKIDFLIQEMNREINTAASKAGSTEAARVAVEVKSEIEKLREQIQNIE